MEFNFLPKLPKSDLDDRSFQDLVDECRLRIPRYCPEWTNYNPSDPGMTLVELFAWMTEQMLMRFNQVPRRNYVTFLELLGVRLRAPAPAQTDVTFYLSASLPENYTIPAGTEVATVRTETEEAIVFSTNTAATIAHPRVRHLLTAGTSEDEPQILRDRFIGLWTMERDGSWHGPELGFFDDRPQPGNCFYLVFDGEEPIEGNAIALNLKGESATSTGINPDMPPRQWQGWNGLTWEPILLRESDDKTQGFSYSQLVRQGGDPLSGADILLHMPKVWPVTHFFTYRGRWVRCVYAPPAPNQPGYSSSPRIVGLSARSIGATVGASQSTSIRNEILGESDGNPGQSFQLQGVPILPRGEEEYILVTPSGGLPQRWQEVNDFADSGPEDLHYTLDSITGIVQFGPLIREPTELSARIRWRERSQTRPPESAALTTARDGNALQHAAPPESMERQHGAVPPRGASIQMVAYRTGGGVKGNVQAGTIGIVKSAVPYVARVVNHKAARNGADGESLEEAAIRVPRMLRTRDRAVTVEDFEALALEAGSGAISRSLCLSPTRKDQAGTVRLLLVPKPDTQSIERGYGIDPAQLSLSPTLIERVTAYLDERRLLGVEVQCRQPEYLGVAVQTEVAVEPEYQNPTAAGQILFSMQVALYRFLNPITGGPTGNGWPFGRPLYPSDIVTLLQNTPGVLYLGAVQLFELRRQNSGWVRTLPREPVINPGPVGLICSWRNDSLRSGHVISLI